MDDCLPLSEVRGRCGPTYGGRCNRDLAWWAVYCNEDNGWCGTTCRHKHAQSADRYDWEPSNCKGKELWTILFFCNCFFPKLENHKR